jgi:hypothetical protein
MSPPRLVDDSPPMSYDRCQIIVTDAHHNEIARVPIRRGG